MNLFLRRVELIREHEMERAIIETPYDELEVRHCPVCGAKLRADNRSGICSRSACRVESGFDKQRNGARK